MIYLSIARVVIAVGVRSYRSASSKEFCSAYDLIIICVVCMLCACMFLYVCVCAAHRYFKRGKQTLMSEISRRRQLLRTL